MTEARQPDGRPKFATRLDDWVHRFRERGVVKRGRVPGVIPYIGYGSTEWVRVLGRVLYLPEAQAHDNENSNESLQPAVAQVARVRG